MKRVIVILWAVVMAANAWAASEVVDGVTWNYSVSSGKASVCRGSSSPAISAATTGAITVPSTLGGYPVTSIGSYAFQNCSGLTSVTIPSSVASIGSSAFSGCGGLTRVDITDLEKWCGISFGTMGANPLCYAHRLYLNGEEVKDLVIPAGVTSIGSSVFSDCSGLKSVTIPSSVTSIGDSAFYNCSGLTSVAIPSSVTSIGDRAFFDCSGLTRVDIADLEKWYIISFGSSYANPLYYAHRLYLNGEEVTDLVIPAGVASIKSYVFSGCSGLTSVTIPSSVMSVGHDAFSGCNGLTRVDITDLERWCGISFGTSYANPLYYAHRLYLNGEEVKDLVIPVGVTSIRDYAFSYCSGLKSVTIPSSVTSIGQQAFSGCSGLTSVTISDGVMSIERWAFSNCSGLTSVTIPEGVTSIGSEAFGYCSGLTLVTIPSSVTSIGSYAFRSCSGLKSVCFLGPPPNGVSDSYLLGYGSRAMIYPREYGAEWQKVCGINSFGGYGQGEKPVAVIVSAAIRENDPTVMDVVYKVTSAKPTVKVRALAFQDGERSFAKVVRPTEFIEDTAKNIGDEITAKEEHKISWRVSADWEVDLAKVKFEVLASDGDLLPLELTTIPKIGDNAAMEISWNAITESQVLDAMFWMYASGENRLTVVDGKAFWDGNLAVNGTTLQSNSSSYYSRTKNPDTGKYDYVYYTNATECVYSKMGFGTLSGDNLKYANEMTRLGLSPSGVRQYAWREVEE